MDATAAQLYDRPAYALAVLGLSGDLTQNSTTRLYLGEPPTNIPKQYQQQTDPQSSEAQALP